MKALVIILNLSGDAAVIHSMEIMHALECFRLAAMINSDEKNVRPDGEKMFEAICANYASSDSKGVAW